MAITALEQVLTDPEYAVRQKAWDGLVEVFGLLPHMANAKGERDFSSEIDVLRILLDSDRSPFVKLGATAMRALTAGLRGGKSPAARGIMRMHEPEPEVFNALRAALCVPGALAQLGATWLAQALAEIANLRCFPLELRTQLAASAHALGMS